ncbi:hypothetical protein INT44_000281 [Umbelopsis vinacea]|uniref:Uncharacterized protein n=1 Tax=Umbelopsis vinacea TaxID=44442 RepID=A0A8H7PKS1_9FUNG|nr:hypothetical protein INT44_000281 [Umbelopsis vinacea]
MHPITLVLPPGLLLIVLPVVTIITVVMLIMATPRMLVFHVFISRYWFSYSLDECSVPFTRGGGGIYRYRDPGGSGRFCFGCASFFVGGEVPGEDDSEEEKDSTGLVDITVNGWARHHFVVH